MSNRYIESLQSILVTDSTNQNTTSQVLNAYLLYMTRVAELMGGTDAEEQMKDVLEFERRLAQVGVVLIVFIPILDS